MKSSINISAYFSYSIQELHELLTSGRITSLELVQASLDRLEKFNPALNAVILVNRENALNAAKQADFDISKGKISGILHGIPVTVKDNIEVKGLPTTAGFAPFREYLSTEDADLVQRLKKAGAIILGKTNLPALTYDLQTNNSLFGRTNNPWDTSRTPGGSSGGCAASIAAGISHLSFCNDSGGSIRIPAHFCGIYGFKASQNGISTKGIVTQIKKKATPLKMRTLLSAGVLGRSMSDLKTAVQIVGSTTESLIRNSSNSSPISLLWIDEWEGFEVDGNIKHAMTELHDRLTQGGIQIKRLAPDQFDFMQTIRLWGHLSNYETGGELPAVARYAGHFVMKPKYSKIPMYTDLLKPINKTKYRKLRREHETLKAQFEALLEPHDGLILPVSSVLAFPHQEPNRKLGHVGIYTTPLAVNEKATHYAIATQSYALPFNVLESPVVTLPIGLSNDRLPIGIQIVGKKNLDLDILEVATRLDALIPPIGMPPL